MTVNAAIGFVAAALMYFSKTARAYEMVIVGRLLVGFHCGKSNRPQPFHITRLCRTARAFSHHQGLQDGQSLFTSPGSVGRQAPMRWPLYTSRFVQRLQVSVARAFKVARSFKVARVFMSTRRVTGCLHLPSSTHTHTYTHTHICTHAHTQTHIQTRAVTPVHRSVMTCYRVVQQPVLTCYKVVQRPVQMCYRVVQRPVLTWCYMLYSDQY